MTHTTPTFTEMKEALIIFIMLLVLLLIISVFGGSIRYAPPAAAAPPVRKVPRQPMWAPSSTQGPWAPAERFEQLMPTQSLPTARIEPKPTASTPSSPIATTTASPYQEMPAMPAQQVDAFIADPAGGVQPFSMANTHASF